MKEVFHEINDNIFFERESLKKLRDEILIKNERNKLI